MKRFALLILLITFSSKAFAYAENVTHGYLNCMACHMSAAGGDLLNDYGRTLSKELMSSFGVTKSEQPLFGLLKNTDNVKWGGDFRSIQTHLKNDQIKQGRGFIMQKNVEVGLKFMKTWFIASAGTQEGPKNFPNRGDFLSERHYLLWEVSDNSRVRAGKFRHHFGINDPVHTRHTKSALGFGSNSEHYNFEFSHFTDVNEVFITSDFGNLSQSRQRQQEKSVSINYAHYIGEKSKLGGSFLYGENGTSRRNIFSQYAIASLPKHNYLKYEFDLQQTFSASADRVDLLAGNITIGNQYIKGLNPYLITEHLDRNLKVHSSRTNSLGAGIQWFPFPHFELQLEYQKIKTRTPVAAYTDSAFALFHFYL